MDCHLSRLMLAFRRSDLTDEDAAALDSHLAGCEACGRFARQTAATDRAFAAAMTAVPVPAGLRDALVKAAAGREAAAWRARAGKWVRGAAAAVGLAFAAGVYGYWTKPTLDTQAVSVEFDQKLDFAGERIPDWLAGQGLPRGLLDGFDLRLPTFAGRSTLLDREVPSVLLVSGPHVAQVYIVPDHRFHVDPDRLADAQTSRGSVRAFRRDRVVLVIVTTSDTLAPFLIPQGPIG